MRTLLSQFCEEFEQSLRPLLAPLGRTTEILSSAGRELPGREILGDLTDLAQQLEMLVDKVAEQQAYVLIFGPLKSGKSTLMNALSSSYVSEVTSLPAYPCMVYVSHADKKQFTVTRYDGETSVFTDPAALRMHIGRAHSELAERVRNGSEEDEVFDPTLHFKHAIRRIDVKAPAGNLARSGAVLVDTPGLYSRMKFGYDRMTREFRNAAASAIFVVKSDNLFLEQVFEEFNDLLELFSRIFLVVNLDSGKRDLEPDGRLVPSLESEDPLRIIEAFENLVMSPTLKQAMDEGRLRIYPVDLLQAASRRLRRSSGTPLDADSGGAPRIEDDVRGQANFDAFLQDLTDSLNSTDYIVAFLGDSLRRASSLLADATDLCTHSSTGRLKQSVEALDREHADADRRRDAARRLASIDWTPVFDELHEKLATTVREPLRKLAERTTAKLDEVIDRWFRTDASLQTLVEDELTLVLLGYQQEAADLVRAELEDRVQAGRAGVRLHSETEADLGAVAIDLGAIGKGSLRGIEADALVQAVHAPLLAEHVPVRKSFIDWILFRSGTTVQRRLLGSPERPSLRIPAAQKSRRLGPPARNAIRRELDRYEGSFFADSVRRIQHKVLGDYSGITTDCLKQTIEQRRIAMEGRLTEIKQELGLRRRVLENLDLLLKGTRTASTAIVTLTRHYGSTDPRLLVKPVTKTDPPRTAAVAAPGEPQKTIQPTAPPAGAAAKSSPAVLPSMHSGPVKKPEPVKQPKAGN
jgi:GTPase SAR1 family protein